MMDAADSKPHNLCLPTEVLQRVIFCCCGCLFSPIQHLVHSLMVYNHNHGGLNNDQGLN